MGRRLAHVYSPAAALEWRGDATVRALKILKANGRLEAQGEGAI